MKTNKAIETHNSIVDAAEILFMSKSVKKVTVNDITKKAGVAKGTFYLYFESKDDLVWHFMEHKLDSILEVINSIDMHGYEESNISAIIDSLIDYIKKYEPILKMIHQVRFYNFLGKKNIEIKYINSLVEPIYLWLDKGKQMGQLDIEDPWFAAYYFTTSIHNMIEAVINNEIPYTIEDFGENIKALLVKILL